VESQETKLKLICEADGQITEGFAIRRPFTTQERMMRAGKIFGILFVIGLGTIVVPILHFILPPLFLLAACIFGTTTWMEDAEVLSGEIACPNCKHVMVFPREAEEWPKIQRCGGCSYLLTIKPV
jgi:hypothetical protein